MGFDSLKGQHCEFIWKNDGVDRFGDAHVFEFVKRIAQEMCGPVEVVDRIVVTVNNSGEVCLSPTNAFHCILNHQPKAITVYKKQSVRAIVSQWDRYDRLSQVIRDNWYDCISLCSLSSDCSFCEGGGLVYAGEGLGGGGGECEA